MTLGIANRYTRDVENTKYVYFYVFLYTHAERYIEEYTVCLYVVHTLQYDCTSLHVAPLQ